ncbi:MAG: AfsR/SARP family transcriptional regulator [Actinobacteria bacterium]|nr:AfsR/SARP family transcriptional regulator [Actinomycetota bacterium]
MDFRLLGPLEVWHDDHRLALGGRQQRALLALLLLTPNRPVSFDRLIDEIWGRDPPENARHSLEVYASKLRKLLRAPGTRELLVHADGGYRLDLQPGELDFERFERLLASGRAKLESGRPRQAARVLRQALALWRGRPLSDLAGERFVSAATGQLDELYLACLEGRIEADLALGRYEELIPELRGLVEEHPARESLWGQLMLVLYRSGRQAEALEAYAQARGELVERYGLEPGPALRELQARILTQDPALAPPPALPPPTSNLPAGLGELIGRERELAELRSQLERDDVRLLTLTGAPGAGKTRLALALAEELLADVLDAVYFVGLAPVRDSAHVPSVIAQALEVEEERGEPIDETLKRKLRDQELLLVLDNLEHLLAAAAFVSELLAAGQGVKVLVTSRTALQLQGERVWTVPSLALPPLDEPASADSVSRYGAVALFATRARAANPTFSLTDANAAAVVGVCARLDGLPLAIELAAARANLLSAGMLLERLGQRLPLLSEGAPRSPDRQRTLRATIDWSYELLDGPRKGLFRRLGVFAGGWTLPPPRRSATWAATSRARSPSPSARSYSMGSYSTPASARASFASPCWRR